MEGGRLPSMRAGLGSGMVGSPSSGALAQTSFIRTSMGLLRVFSEEAIKTAGEYSLACGRTHVANDDMQKALKYQARMFFQQVEDVDGRVDEAAREYLAGAEEESEEEEEGEEESGEAEEEESGEAEEEEEAEEDDETNSVSTSNSKSTTSTVSASSLASSVVASALAPGATHAEAVCDEAELARCKASARRVDAIVASWDLYEPTDPLLIMIKKAIDATDSRPAREEEEAPDAPPSKRPCV